MKDSSSSSRSTAGRVGGDPPSAVADAAASNPGVMQASAAGGLKAFFKDPMFSSSDTDDCDADKLVIDLDAAGSTDASSNIDARQTSSSVSLASISVAAPAASGSSRSDSAKVRTTEGGAKSSSGGSHRSQHSSGKSSSNQQSDGTQQTQPPPDKGLKMKIKCSQAAGGPARHEISQFHTQVNSSVPSASASSSSTGGSNSSSAGAKASGSDRSSDKDAHGRSDRTASSSGSHRKDQRPSTKDRSVNNKDRSGPDGQSHASSGVAAAVQPTACNAAASLPSSNVAVSAVGAVKDPANDAAVKPAAESDRDRDAPSSAAQWNHSTTSQRDPYEFSVKVEESMIGRPTKKIKLDRADAACSPIPQVVSSCPTAEHSTSPKLETRDVCVDACHVGVVTDPDCLGPCDPGTTVTLEGIVWNETENGLLVVNVTWRGKTYVGTLMDATKHHWAPPRFATESPTSDLDGRTPKGRGKRGRTCSSAARSEINGSDRKLRSNRCTTGAAAKSGMSSAGSSSPVRSDSGPSGAPAAKKPRGSDSAGSNANGSSDAARAVGKTNRSESRMSVNADAENSAAEGVLIECPAPHCSKKYRHINGLRYHQSRSHPNMNFDDDAEDADAYGKMNSKVKSDVDTADVESTSDVDKNEAADGLAGNVLHASDSTSKHDKKGKSKSKSAVKHAFVEAHDAPSSPSVGTGKLGSDDASASDKQKYRKKDRERTKDGSLLDQMRDTELAGDDVAVRQPVSSGGRVCENAGQIVSVNEGRSLDSDCVYPTEDSSTVKRGSETVSVIRMATELNSAVTPVSNGEIHLNMLETCEGTSALNSAGLVPKGDSNQTVLSASDSSAASPGPLPSKRPKTTPTKYGIEYDNPHSPAYSDISDANDSAPMLEKEATPSASVDDDDLTSGGGSVIERCPVSQHLADSFTGPYSSSASSSLYGQPPCLTPAVVPPSALDAAVQQSVSIKMEKSESIIGHQDDRAGIRANPLRPPPSTRVPNDSGRHSGNELIDLADRNLGSLQRSAPRSHGDSSSPQPQPAAPPMMPPNIFMQYPYAAAGPGGYPPLELLQHPEYRALVSQGILRRPDQPPSSFTRPPGDPQPDFKSFPGSLKPGDDRKSKSDSQMPPCSLPTPPVLIPDRGVVSFDEQDNRVLKSKGGDRRDDSQRSAYYPQQYGSGGDRQRRHEESSSGKECSSNKPSAVVAPQARDRILTSSGSGKPRSEDQSRSGLSSAHDRSSHKPVPKNIPVSSQQDASSSRQQKDVPMDKCGRDEKSLVGARGSGGNSTAYKKDESGISISPITSVPLPLAPTYPPYYPYLPAQFDPAFYGGLNPMIGYAGAPPGPFLHPAQVGYLPPSTGGDVAAIISPAGGPHLSPSDGKPRDGPPRGFYPGGGEPTGGGQSCAPVHKIHELKEVAKGGSGPPGEGSQSSSGAGLRDIVRPESRSGALGGSGGLPKELERGGASSPPTQRHVHTHHHMHMLGPPMPPLFGSVFPGDPSMMSSSQTGASSGACPSLPRPYIGK